METKKDPQIIRRLALLAEGVVVAEVVGVAVVVAEVVAAAVGVAGVGVAVVAEGVWVGVRQQLPPVAEAERFRSKEGRLLVRVLEEGMVVRELAVPVAEVVEVVEVGVVAGYRNTADRIQEELRLVAEEVEEGAVAEEVEGAAELHNTEDQILGQMPVRELRDRRRGRSTYR